MLYPFPVKAKSLGGIARIYRLIKFLAGRGHKVWLGCFANEGELQESDLEEIKTYCQEVVVVAVKPMFFLKKLINFLSSRRPSYVLHFHSPLMQKEVKRLLNEAKIELMHVEFTYLSDYTREVSQSQCVKLLVDEELNFQAMQRAFKAAPFSLHGLKSLWEARKFKRYELSVVTFFDKVLTITDQEREVLLKHRLNLDVEVYPNTVDTRYFAPLDAKEEPLSISFVGNFAHYPNEDGIIWFLNKVYPRILLRFFECQLYVVGANITPAVRKLHNGREIKIVGYVDDIRPYLAKSSVFVCPLINGGGMRGKVLEAMALEKAVVSTSIGAEGIAASHSKHLLIADKPTEFAKAVEELFVNKSLRTSLGKEARKLVQQFYDDENVFSKLETTYLDLIAKRSG